MPARIGSRKGRGQMPTRPTLKVEIVANFFGECAFMITDYCNGVEQPCRILVLQDKRDKFPF